MKKAPPLVFVLALVATLNGCATVGPKSIRDGRFDYNRAIIDTRNEQMLANLVRMRYRDPPFFLEVSSVSTQYVFGGSAAAGARLGNTGAESRANVGAGAAYEERPTVTYLPLKGDEFVHRLLSPVEMEAVVLLALSGWRIDRVMRCCVLRVNDLWNAPTASGPTPDLAPDYADFAKMAGALNRLLKARAAEVRFRPRLQMMPENPNFELTLHFEAVAGTAEDVTLVKRLLGLSEDLDEFRLTSNPTHRKPDEIGILPRSLMGAMNYLSQTVDPPQRDIDAGFVTSTLNKDGTAFDWNELTGGLFEILSSLDEPETAFVKVRYRNAWFYIDDSDLSSKSTFNLLDQLFQLQAGQAGGAAPLLTLPIGG